MPDLRISELPSATAPADTDLHPLVQSLAGGALETRRASLAQLRGALLADRGAHVRDYGARGDGTTNDAPAIQAAVNDLAARGGGTLQFGPRTYRIASAVTVANAMVRLRGAGFAEGPGAGQGTWLSIDGTGFVPFTFSGVAARGSGVADLAVQQAHPAPGPGWAPTDHPHVFRVEDCLGGVDFDNLLLARVHRGIYCRNSGRLDIRRLRGQVFGTAVEVDECLDVPRLHNIHLWSFWSADQNVLRWQQANADALVFRRCDGVFIDQAFALACRSMVRFSASPAGTPADRGGVTTKFYIGQLYADFARHAVWVDADAGFTTGQIGALTCQGEVVGAPGTAIAGAAGLQVDASNTRIQAGSLRIDRVEDNAIRVNGSGNRLDIGALRCNGYNTRNTGAAAIHLADSGAATPNAAFLATPPFLESGNGGPLTNAGSNAVLAQQSPGGRAARPGLAVGAGDTGLFLPAAGTLAASAGGAEVLRATAAGTLTLGGAPGAHALEVSAPAATANRLLASGAAAGAAVSLSAQGADANISLDLLPKGAGAVRTVTPAIADSSTAIATTAWVRAQGYTGGAAAVTSVAGRTGAVTLAVADIAGAAPLAAPVFTGSLALPGWTTAARPATATAGMLGFNSETGRLDLCIAGGTPGTWRGVLRQDGDTATGPLLANSAGGGNAARLAGAAAGSPVVIGVDAPGSADANVGIVLGQPKGTGAITAQLPDGATTGGVARGSNAVDWQLSRTGTTQVASGANAAISGGLRNTASGTAAAVGGGQANTASGTFAAVAGGQSNIAGGSMSWSPGGLQADARATHGKGVFASGQFAASGDAQAGEHVLRRQTTDATQTRLTSDNAAAGAANSIPLPNNGTYMVRLRAVARQTAGTAGTVGDSAGFEVSALVRRGANAAATVLAAGGGAAVVPALNDAGAAAWRLAVAADTTNGGIAVSGTGEANKTILWVARIASAEVVG